MHVVEDAVEGIDLEGSLEQAWNEMKEKGANVVTSDELY